MRTLEHLKDTARRSYYWISQDPDGRGDRTITDYSNQLDGDVEKITNQGATPEQVARYKKGYEEKLTKWLSSQSNCASSFITGGSNFPVARQKKLHGYADGHYKTFIEWRDKVLTAYDKYEKRAKIEAAGGELEIAKNKLAELEILQERYVAINKAYRAYLKNTNSLATSGLSTEEIRIVIEYVPQYSFDRQPIPKYRMSNNNATIKHTQKRIAVLESKEAAISEGNKEIAFNGGKVILNVDIDRLQILHDVKPEPNTLSELKRNGFKWSPFYKAWQRQLTDNAKYATMKLLSIEI